jgi:hypothetical protein
MALDSLLTHDHGAVWPLQGLGGYRDSWEREEVVRVLTNGTTWRRSCGDGHTMTLNRGDRWCSDGEMILSTRMRYWSRGGAMDNRDALVVPFIEPWGGGRWAVKVRKAAAVELQWHQLRGDGNGEGEVMECSHFWRGRGGEVRWLHNVVGRQHSEERCGGRGGRRRRLASRGRRWPKEIGSIDQMRDWAELLTGPAKKNMAESIR